MDILYLHFINKYKTIDVILGSYETIFRDIENFVTNNNVDFQYDITSSTSPSSHPFFPIFHISYLYFIHPKDPIDIAIVKQIITLILSFYHRKVVDGGGDMEISDCFLRIITDNEGFLATLLKYRRIFSEVLDYSKTQIKSLTQIYSHPEHTKAFLRNFIHYIIDEIYDIDILMVILGNPHNNIDFIQLRNKIEEFIYILDRIIDFYRSNKMKSRIEDYSNKVNSMKNKRTTVSSSTLDSIVNSNIELDTDLKKRRHSISLARPFSVRNCSSVAMGSSCRLDSNKRRNSVLLIRKTMDENIELRLQAGFELLLKNIDETRFHKLCDFLQERSSILLKNPDNIIKIRSLIENRPDLSQILLSKNENLFHQIGLEK